MATKPPKRKTIKAGQKVRAPGLMGSLGVQTRRAPERPEVGGLAAFLNRPVRQGLNFLGDLGGGFQQNKFNSWGTGAGDQLFGVTPGYYAEKTRESRDPRYNSKQSLLDSVFGAQNKSIAGSKGSAPTDLEREVNSPGGYGQKWTRGYNPHPNGFGSMETAGYEGIQDPRGFADILAEVQAMLQAQGAGGGVSYDPLRAQARSQWEDADARTLAMYQQLQNSIGAEAGNLGKVYDEGVAATNAATQFANEQNAQSAQNVNSMVGQQANALGIQEAVANDINAGNLSGQDQMARAADTAARGQITSNLLGSNKVSALDFNSDLVGAAGLQGAMDRGKRSQELQRLLAGYDVAEQEANAQSQSSYASDSMDLAKMLFGQENENWQFQNNMQRYGISEANDQGNWEQDYLRKMAATANKPQPLTRDQAIARTLQDLGYDELPPNGSLQRSDFFKYVRSLEKG